MKIRKDRSGEKLNNFIVLEHANKKNHSGNSLWKIKCIHCGKEKIDTYDNASKNNSCGCLRWVARRNGVWKGAGDISGSYWSNLIHGAKRRKIDVLVDIKDAWNLFLKQGKKCSLTATNLKFNSSQENNFSIPSLDRIDSNKGYIKNNLQWVSKIINNMKWDLSNEEFIYWCKKSSSI